MRKILSILLSLFLLGTARAAEKFISFQQTADPQLRLTGTSDTIRYDANGWLGVRMAVHNLRQDLTAVTGSPCAPIIVGTVGRSDMASHYKAQSRQLKGKWEQYLIPGAVLVATNKIDLEGKPYAYDYEIDTHAGDVIRVDEN